MFGFVAWMIAFGYPPLDAVLTAAATLGLILAVTIIPRGAVAIVRFLQKIVLATLPPGK